LPGAGAPGISDDAPDSASRLLVMRDFNRDGIVDMAEATSPAEGSSGTGLLTISLGQANGSFRQMALKTVLGHNPQSIVAGDFNKDGIEDLIVGDDDGTLLLFLGDGTGKLVAAGAIAHLDSVVSIAVADFNHDGIPDLAVSDWRASSVKVLLGVGDGSFRSGWPFPLRLAGTTPHLTAADFNDDGIPDLAVVYEDDDGDTFDVMLGNGTGSFTHSAALSLVRDPNSHCAPEIRLQ
jgi:WD40 repeat protein